MLKSFRKRIFKKLAGESFRNRFLNSSAENMQDLIYTEAVKQGRPQDLVAINITDQDKTNITYYVMKDYLSIDGIRVPVSGVTAQKLASAWGMKLPSTKMSKEIYASANVQSSMIGMPLPGMTSAKTSVEFNEKTNNKIKSKPTQLVGGHMKDVVNPEKDPSRLGLGGGYKDDKTAWHGGDGISIHPPNYFDYSSGFRGVDDNVVINGTQYTLTNIFSNPDLIGLRKYFSYTGSWGQYKTDTTPAQKTQPIAQKQTPETQPIAQKQVPETQKAPTKIVEAPVQKTTNPFTELESLERDFPDLGTDFDFSEEEL